MEIEVKIEKWKNDSRIVFPEKIVKELNLKEGEKITLEFPKRDSALIIKK